MRQHDNPPGVPTLIIQPPSPSGGSQSVFTDNGDNTFTHDDGMATQVTIPTTSVVDNGDGTYDIQQGTSPAVSVDTSAGSNPYDNTNSGLTATNVQDALDEIAECTQCNPPITQAGHGFVCGTAIYQVVGGAWAAADASNPLSVGTHVAEVIDANTFVPRFDGLITCTTHGLGMAGELLYVSDTTPGLLTTTEPSGPGTISNPLGEVRDTNTIAVYQLRPYANPSTGSGAAPVNQVTQAGHGFSVGDVINRNGGAWTKADASDLSLAGQRVVSQVIDANTFLHIGPGEFLPTQLSFFDGDDLFLSDTTPGGMTSTPPTTTGNMDQVVGFVDGSGIWIVLSRPFEIS